MRGNREDKRRAENFEIAERAPIKGAPTKFLEKSLNHLNKTMIVGAPLVGALNS